MKFKLVTILMLTFFAGHSLTATAQPVRNGNDIVWALDIDGATLTMDGVLDEPEWLQAETISIRRELFYSPGGGWQDFTGFTIEAPTDPVDATIYFLRDGNILWLGVEAADKSIGGTPDFFQHDGLVLSVLNKTNRENAHDGPHWFNGSNTDEFFYSWLNRGFVEDSVGMGPFFFGNQAADGLPLEGVWNGAAVIDGVSNDDMNGMGVATEDVGYTMELWIDLDSLGVDLSGPDGGRLPLTAGIYDLDYSWPSDPNLNFRSRAWWQNPWGGDMPFGAGFVYGHPDVTVNSGDVPGINEPELYIARAPDGAEITIDGVLDESVWENLDAQVSLQYQMAPEKLDALPGYGPYYTHWFRPGFDENVTVVDPSTGDISLFYAGNTLYVGLDSDDQAVSGQTGTEARFDGLRVTIRAREDTDGGQMLYPFVGFAVVVDSMGTAVVLENARGEDGNPAPGIQAAASLKDASTAGDPSDVDTGYQIELAIDLEQTLGFPADLSGEVIYVAATYFDGDDLDPEENSYGTRIWWLSERGNGDFGGPAALGYFDPTRIVASEDGMLELPEKIALRGNFPNPFNPVTTLRYALPTAGEVTLHVYDVLGRQVTQVARGVRAAGEHAFTFDAAGLASGLYLYRIELTAQATGDVQISNTGRMVLLK